MTIFHFQVRFCSFKVIISYPTFTCIGVVIDLDYVYFEVVKNLSIALTWSFWGSALYMSIIFVEILLLIHFILNINVDKWCISLHYISVKYIWQCVLLICAMLAMPLQNSRGLCGDVLSKSLTHSKEERFDLNFDALFAF